MNMLYYKRDLIHNVNSLRYTCKVYTSLLDYSLIFFLKLVASQYVLEFRINKLIFMSTMWIHNMIHEW